MHFPWSRDQLDEPQVSALLFIAIQISDSYISSGKDFDIRTRENACSQPLTATSMTLSAPSALFWAAPSIGLQRSITVSLSISIRLPPPKPLHLAVNDAPGISAAPSRGVIPIAGMGMKIVSFRPQSSG
jgi:hypothetical protein